MHPDLVENARDRKLAWGLYTLLVAALIAYVTNSIANAYAERSNPPTSFTVKDEVWRLPHLILWRTANFTSSCVFRETANLPPPFAIHRQCTVEDGYVLEDQSQVILFRAGKTLSL